MTERIETCRDLLAGIQELYFGVLSNRTNTVMRIIAVFSSVFLPLTLERDGVLFFPLTWTVVHPIDAASPLAGETPESLAAARAEFLILLSGNDETFQQSVSVRSSYEASELVWNARFVSPYNPPAEDGSLSVDVGRLSAIEKL